MAVIRALLVALALLAGACAARAQHGEQPMHHGFGGAERWSAVFDDPARDAWQRPDDVVRALALAPDAVVADVGSGTGYFAVRLARAVPRGRVIGSDLEPDMVRFLRERAEREGLSNLQAVRATQRSPNLPETVDLVLLVDTYHHLAQRIGYFNDLKRSLKPGGRVAIIDFRMDSPVGPPPRHRLAPEDVTREMTEAGYRLAAQHDFLPHQYLLVFAPR
jgi:SAM-dependent methyltransferase